MKQGKRVLVSLLAALVFGAVWFYLALPAINVQDIQFYLWLGTMCLVYLFVYLTKGEKDSGERKVIFVDGNAIRVDPTGFAPGTFKGVAAKLPLILLAVMAVVVLVGSVFSWKGFRAQDYYDLLPVESGDFTQDVAEISYNEIPMLDKASAEQLGRRTLGNISTNGAYSDLVSQFEVSSNYTQINYQGRPVRVSPLEYGNLIKWFNNRAEGLPGYIVVDMVTQEADLVLMEEGIRYSTAEHFDRYLARHIRFQYPTFLFGEPTFELDEEGNPYWICPRVVKRIGLFGGEDIQGAVLVNAVTGESSYYEQVPTWVDRVYMAELIIQQYDNHGTLVNGFLNSIFGEKGCTVTTDGYNYIAMNDDVYLYTGITSTGTDESNVGFILSNQRTKETKFYAISGAEEYSAMSSAQGAVQHLGYTATFPILLNISDQPTYFMALKDSAQLVKMYSMVNVTDYQLTATGQTVEECQQNYEKLLEGYGIEVTSPVESENLQTVTGQIAEIRSAVIEGTSWYYVRLEGKSWFYGLSAADNAGVVLLDVGDTVSIDVNSQLQGEIRNGILHAE